MNEQADEWMNEGKVIKDYGFGNVVNLSLVTKRLFFFRLILHTTMDPHDLVKIFLFIKVEGLRTRNKAKEKCYIPSTVLVS